MIPGVVFCHCMSVVSEQSEQHNVYHVLNLSQYTIRTDDEFHDLV